MSRQLVIFSLRCSAQMQAASSGLPSGTNSPSALAASDQRPARNQGDARGDARAAVNRAMRSLAVLRYMLSASSGGQRRMPRTSPSEFPKGYPTSFRHISATVGLAELTNKG